ncbi:MAG: hypothetical protein WCG75_02640 [Armatimonadota bacterium]
MKNVLLLAGALTAIVGCSKGSASADLEGQGSKLVQDNKPEPGGPPQVQADQNHVPANSNPSQKPNIPAGSVNGGHESASTLRVDSRPNPSNPGSNPRTEIPKENPNAAPPKQGEKVAENNRIEVGPKSVEVEGVCKLTEDSAVCWRPNGEKNETLAAELTSAIKSKADSYSNTFQFKFMKKNRILVIKTVTKPMKSGTDNMGSYSLGLMNDYSGMSEGREGWSNGNSAFSGSNGNGFDQTQTDRQVLTGAFNKETKTFPLRYQYTTLNRMPKVIPFSKGQFTIEGNTYEIVSVSDKPESGQPNNMMYGGGVQPGMKPPKYTYVKINVVKITNPYTILNLSPADDSGMPYSGLNANGEPISAAEMRKMQEEENKKMMEAQKSGKPYAYNGMGRGMGNYIQSINLDPANDMRMGAMGRAINVDISKIKKLSVSISTRTVFVFDKIKLDAN